MRAGTFLYLSIYSGANSAQILPLGFSTWPSFFVCSRPLKKGFAVKNLTGQKRMRQMKINEAKSYKKIDQHFS